MITDDPCDEWPLLLIPGVFAAAIVDAIKRVIPDTPIMSGIMKSRDFAKGGTIAFASDDASFLDDDGRRWTPLMGMSGPEAIVPLPTAERMKIKGTVTNVIVNADPPVTPINLVQHVAVHQHRCCFCGGSSPRHAIGCPNEGSRR